MINVELRKIDFYENHFNLFFMAECGVCKRESPVRKLTGNVLSRIFSECRKCGDQRVDDLVSFILDTCKSTWGYNQADLDVVTERLKLFKKK